MHIVLKNNDVLAFPQVKVMGIINATPDSFFRHSRAANVRQAAEMAAKMIEEGAEILDIGGESTRPGCDPVSPEEEAARILPIVEEIRRRFPKILLSVDTYHAYTAERAFQAGADILNDISALRADSEMAGVAAKYGVPVILMHMQGTPKQMQDNPCYTDVVEEVHQFFAERIAFSLSCGIKRERLILDPGIGFGKNLEHNLSLIRSVKRFQEFDLPLLMAGSRKTFISQSLGDLAPEERLEGTMALSAFSAMQGVQIVRVHDVKENVRIIRMMEKFL